MHRSTIESTIAIETDVLQVVSFQVGRVRLAIDIRNVQEINRHFDICRVPRSDRELHGVINLRGEVVTVLNPHEILHIESEGEIDNPQLLILKLRDERVAVLVDRVLDIFEIDPADLRLPPTNLPDLDRHFVQGVYLNQAEIYVLLAPAALESIADSLHSQSC